MFCWFCFARLLRLSLDRSWAIVHPSREAISTTRILCCALGQPHCWCQRRPSGFQSQTIATLHRFPLGITRATSFARSEKPLWPLLAPLFLERQKFKNFGQILKKCPFWTQSGKIWSVLHFLGCGLPNSAAILRHSAAFCGNSAAILRRPVPHVGFGLEKSIFWPRKSQKKADFGRKTYVCISGFLRQFCGRF